jgi:hypothetical protein
MTVQEDLKLNARINLAIIIASVCIFIFCQYQKLYYTPDDTFIYLQYSKNFASGNGFAFNKGEPSFGVTSPLWAVILSIPFVIGADPFWFAKFLDLLIFVLAVYVFFRFTGFFFEKNSVFRILALFIFIINPWVLRSSFTGMETSLGMLMVLLLVYLYYAKRRSLLFLLAGPAMLVRPELFLLVVILLFFAYRELKKENRIAWLNTFANIGLLSLTVVPFLIYSFFVFGTIISNSNTGKSIISTDFGILFSNTKEILRILFFLAPVEFMFAIILLLSKKTRDMIGELLPVLVWILALPLLYISATSAVMARYFLIIYPFIAFISAKFLSSVRVKPKVVLVCALIVFLSYSQFIFFSFVKPYTDGFTEGITQCLQPIGSWLNQNTAPGSRILVNDVGVIGFYADRYIIDAAALINRDLKLNRKILSVPNTEKEYPHIMLNFIQADYLIEKDTISGIRLDSVYDYRLTPLKSFVFPRMWVLDPNPKYYTIYKLTRKNPGFIR